MEETIKTDSLSVLAGQFDVSKFRALNEEMTFGEYLEQVKKNPRLARTAYQRIYDMILSKGTSQFKRYRKTYTHYNFFDDPEGTAGCPIFGLDDTINHLVKFIRGAAGGYGTDKRVLLLHGPVGSSKSTICRLFKRGLEEYSKTTEGSWYTYKWVDLPDDLYLTTEDQCAMRDDPLKLIPPNMRAGFLKEINENLLESIPEKERASQYAIILEGDLNPRCKLFMSSLMKKYDGDWGKVVRNHIKVIRMVYSEVDRIGIGTFQPKDEKNQDATELTGDINYGKMPTYGADSDPRAFNFDGEFEVGNRGMTEFIEVLKLDKAFLYDLLGASQEKSIKPKKFSQISIDTVLIGHSNNPEYEKLKSDKTMEALRDRTVKVDVPYLDRWSDELKVLRRDYNPNKVKQHIAPHTLEIASLWAILTRLEDDKDGKLSLVDKAKLYDGRFLPGYTEDTVKELKDKYPDECMYHGVSARYVQDKISNCLSSHYDYINPFMVLNELREGLFHSSLLTDKNEAERYVTCIDLAMKELDNILKTEVQKALVGDEATIIRLCANYIDNIVAYINKSKVTNPYTGKDQEPDERLMRAIEEKIEIPEVGADDFRRSIVGFIGTLSTQGKKFTWDSNPLLKKALEAKLFEDTKDHIKLSALNTNGASVVDPDLQEKIDAIKQRLIQQHGYNTQSASDVLAYVGSIFARGESANDD